MVVFPLPRRPVPIVMATFGVWSNFNLSEQFLSIKYRVRDYIKHEEVNDFIENFNLCELLECSSTF